jgi:hypothetical protein
MSKMKVDPTMCMKTNHKVKLSCVNKAKRVRFGHESCSITRLAHGERSPADGESGFRPNIVGPIGRLPQVKMLRALSQGVVVRHQHGSHGGSMGGNQQVHVRKGNGKDAQGRPKEMGQRNEAKWDRAPQT